MRARFRCLSPFVAVAVLFAAVAIADPQVVCTPSQEICDGCDNDCDGTADEGVAPVGCGQPTPANCIGTMTCVAASVPAPGGCTAGVVWGACSNNPQTEVCDGVDNDCDGTADNGVPPIACVPVGTPPGLVYGGTSQCTMGLLACGSGLCTGFVGPSAEVCDGTDNDCDGMVDEGVVGVGVACGFNQPPCTPGTTACVNGALVCQGGVWPQSEVCDGIDNNCNGFVDDPPLADAPPVGQGGCWTLPGNCCSFSSLDWCPPPGGTCNGAGVLAPPCAAGVITCGGASGWTCLGSTTPSAEVCDGADNDCDGEIDDGLAPVACVPAGTPPGLVYGGASQCRMGLLACGGPGCEGFVGPSTEECDGIDNDCDGVIDEGVVGVGEACGLNQPPCTPGTTACVGGALVCQGGVGPQSEVCDGIDNDCDGTPDDPPLADAPPAGQGGCWTLPGNCCTFSSLNWCPPPGGTCNGSGSLSPPCAAGALTCSGASGWVCGPSTAPAPEVCDGVDNNCDGIADNGVLPQVGAVCGTDVGECTAGVLACSGGVLDCSGDVPPIPELCDGFDNDCDGNVDNGIPVGSQCTPAYDHDAFPGQRDFAPCQPGIYQCDGSGGLACVGGVTPAVELCDGQDNDCDGVVDNGLEVGSQCTPAYDHDVFPGRRDFAPCVPGLVRCDGSGGVTCVGGVAPAREVRDRVDNDCDGVVDNGFLPLDGVPVPLLSGAGKTVALVLIALAALALVRRR